MRCAKYIKVAAFVLVSAQAMMLSVDEGVKVKDSDNEWIKGVSADREAQCTVENECIVGSGLGTCKVTVDPAKAFPFASTLGSTGQTELVEVQNNAESGSITISGMSNTSHWNLCWKSRALGTARRLQVKGVTDFCYYVNGICFLWASPCSGGCSQMNAFSSYSSFCPNLRYATPDEFSMALPTLNANRRQFFELCAASQLDPQWNHCDFGVHQCVGASWAAGANGSVGGVVAIKPIRSEQELQCTDANSFTRVIDGSWNELVLVCAPAEYSGTSSSR